MKAMIFAAGIGSRLRPITDVVPKALVEVGGKPAIDWAVEMVRNAGAADIAVNIHHHADKMREWAKDKRGIHLSDESERLLDTGGGLLKAAPLLDDDAVIVANADIICSLDLSGLVENHLQSGADATLLCQDRDSSRKLLFDSEGYLFGWAKTDGSDCIPAGILEVPGLEMLAFGGISVIRPSVFKALAEYASLHGPVFSTTPFYVWAATGRWLKVKAYVEAAPYRWCDIGKLQTLARAREMFSS